MKILILGSLILACLSASFWLYSQQAIPSLTQNSYTATKQPQGQRFMLKSQKSGRFIEPQWNIKSYKDMVLRQNSQYPGGNTNYLFEFYPIDSSGYGWIKHVNTGAYVRSENYDQTKNGYYAVLSHDVTPNSGRWRFEYDQNGDGVATIHHQLGQYLHITGSYKYPDVHFWNGANENGKWYTMNTDWDQVTLINQATVRHQLIYRSEGKAPANEKITKTYSVGHKSSITQTHSTTVTMSNTIKTSFSETSIDVSILNSLTNSETTSVQYSETFEIDVKKGDPGFSLWTVGFDLDICGGNNAQFGISQVLNKPPNWTPPAI